MDDELFSILINGKPIGKTFSSPDDARWFLVYDYEGCISESTKDYFFSNSLDPDTVYVIEDYVCDMRTIYLAKWPISALLLSSQSVIEDNGFLIDRDLM